KFHGADQTLGTQMKSVGEVMAMGRTFPEALQKACRSLENGRTGLCGGPESKENDLQVVREKISGLNPVRMFQIVRAMELGESIKDLYDRTGFDPWFLGEMKKIVDAEAKLRQTKFAELKSEDLLEVKRLGFSDKRLSELCGVREDIVRNARWSKKIRPAFKTI